MSSAKPSPARLPAWLQSTVLLAVGLGLLALTARAQATDLEVGVRASVPDGKLTWHKDNTVADGDHSMVYGILAIKLVENAESLVKPVFEKRVVSLLMDTLDENGFREFVPGEKPGILITVSYGRGEMSNPYIRDTGAVGGAASAGSPDSRPAIATDSQPAGDAVVPNANGTLPSLAGGGPAIGAGGQGAISTDAAPLTQTVTGASPMQLFDERSHGYEAKLQKAGYEKLFIRITAWEYPNGAKYRPHMLWKTIMVVDDPDHRDLNMVAAAMLAAGGPFFDKVSREHEVEVHKPLPDGRVKVGEPVVREPFKPGTEK